MSGDLEFDDAWRTDARKRAIKLFPNQGLQPVAQLMASAHKYAIQYVEQAPVIVIAAARGSNPRRRNERAYLTGQLAEMCKRGDRLRTVMAAYGMPQALRALKGVALTPTKWPIVFRLARMNPSKLAQIIPASSGGQMAWLRALDNWLSQMDRRYPSDPGLFFEWAAEAYRDVTQRECRSADDMADFAAAHPETFNTGWTRAQAEAAEQVWHLTLARRSEAAKQMTATGVGFDTPIDYAPLPTAVEIKGLSFTALQSGEDLFLEGAAMRHCVASYIQAVVGGSSRIYSVKQDGRRIATLELKPTRTKKIERHVIDGRGERLTAYETRPDGYQLCQLKGPCNAAPTKRIREASEEFVKRIAQDARP